MSNTRLIMYLLEGAVSSMTLRSPELSATTNHYTADQDRWSMGGRHIQKEQALHEAYKELILPPFDTRHAHIHGLLVAISHIDIQLGYVRIPCTKIRQSQIAECCASLPIA